MIRHVKLRDHHRFFGALRAAVMSAAVVGVLADGQAVGAASSTDYDYNTDRQLTVVTRPDGLTITYAYDSAGRLDTITTPNGVTTYTYDAAGRVETIAAPGGDSLTYGYDGSLIASTTWAGTVNGSVERTYDNDLRLKTITVNGQDPITYQYDNDGLVKQAGDLSITRNPQNALVTGTALGNLTDTYEYNSFGEMSRYTAKFNGDVLYDLQLLNRDFIGRITEKVETVEGTSHSYEYEYVAAGRLFHVIKDGVETAEYTYDPNGNRLTGPGLSTTPIYDNQDRLLSYDGAAYTYTANGELLTKSDSSGTTTYDYDVFGALRAVDQPGTVDVTYVVDSNGRRIGRRENGTLVQGLLYQDALRPVAEVDGAGSLVSRFVYASVSNVPAYLIKGGATYRIITDHLGSLRLAVDVSTGMVAQRMRHNEFGQVVVDDNSGCQPFGFAGGLVDGLTSLVRMGARDYDPRIGRWATKDPILFSGGDTNVFRYAHGDSVNNVDPTGLQDIFPITPLDLAAAEVALPPIGEWISEQIDPNTCLGRCNILVQIYGPLLVKKLLGTKVAVCSAGLDDIAGPGICPSICEQIPVKGSKEFYIGVKDAY